MEEKRNNQLREPPQVDLSPRAATQFALTVPRLVLASASPRRAEILRNVGWDFEILAVDVDESRHSDEDAPAYVERVAWAKADTAFSEAGNQLVVGADTVVVMDGEILGKPRGKEDAHRMLRMLQNRWHQVLTGIAIVNDKFSVAAHEITDVKFAPMTETEINWYVGTGEPMDKAGAYAIQGLGARFIEGIRGDYLNVVGLPLRLLYNLVVVRPNE